MATGCADPLAGVVHDPNLGLLDWRVSPKPDDHRAWRRKTDAKILRGDQFRRLLRERDFVAVGVMGYAGAWSRSGLEGGELTRFVADVDRCVRSVILEAREAHGDALIIVSGATDQGVLSSTYAACVELGVRAAGITTATGLGFPVAPLDYLIPAGRRFGDESQLFVSVCQAFVVLGGGAQSEAEARAARARGKPVTLVRGFGGAADLLAEEGLDGAIVRERHET